MVRSKIIDVKISELLCWYLQILEESLEKHSKKFVKKRKKDRFEESIYLGGYSLYSRYYPNILRKSFLITCYSFLEHVLVEECRNQKKFKNLPLDIKDLGKSGIDRAKNYLKLVRLDISQNNQWNEIKNIQKIRNCLVHADGVLTECGEEKIIRSYINSRSDISIENDEIVLGADYCKYVVKILSEFEYDVKSALSFEHQEDDFL